MMVSFDVKSLFTKVPTEDIKPKLENDGTLEERTLMTPLTITNLIKRCTYGFNFLRL